MRRPPPAPARYNKLGGAKKGCTVSRGRLSRLASPLRLLPESNVRCGGRGGFTSHENQHGARCGAHLLRPVPDAAGPPTLEIGSETLPVVRNPVQRSS